MAWIQILKLPLNLNQVPGCKLISLSDGAIEPQAIYSVHVSLVAETNVKKSNSHYKLLNSEFLLHPVKS